MFLKKTRSFLKASAIGLLALGTLSVTVNSASAKHRHYRYHHSRRMAHITDIQGGAYPGRWVRFRKNHKTHYYWKCLGERYHYRHGNWYQNHKHAKKHRKRITKRRSRKRKARPKRHVKRTHHHRRAVIHRHRHRSHRR